MNAATQTQVTQVNPITNRTAAEIQLPATKEALIRQHPASKDANFKGVIASRMSSFELVKEQAWTEMASQALPDLRGFCYELHRVVAAHGTNPSALTAVPVLNKLASFDQDQLDAFEDHPETSHVLVNNALLKVVLIHWKPGKISSIHGHPKGGCVFRVLRGSLEELRYTSTESPQLLATSRYQRGATAYIDDTIGYHAVGNPFGQSAISLHVYTYASN